MKSSLTRATDGRILCVVSFEMDAENPKSPMVEAVYEVHLPQDFTRRSVPVVTGPIAVTRVDTRETVEIPPALQKQVLECACDCARGADDGW